MEIQNWKAALPDNFSPESRVWVYQSNRSFDEKELKEINEQLYQFYTQWISHNRPVKGWAGILFNRFIIFMADDTMDRLCGSAVDNSVRLVKSIERQYQIHLLNRTLLAFKVQDKVELLPMNQIAYALENGMINEDTLYFNNTVTTKAALDENWLIKIRDSWLRNKLSSRVTT